MSSISHRLSLFLCGALLPSVALLASACSRTHESPPASIADASTVSSAHDPAPPAPVAPTEAEDGRAEALAPPSPRQFTEQFSTFSEGDRYFFSDNYISNETSYLQIADDLEPRGGAYIGVGPEQNFTYIARTRPEVAYIVDIRRGNALLHLMYKAVFHQARNRSEFVARLIGREAAIEEPKGASLGQVLQSGAGAKPSPEEFERVHAALLKYIQGDLGVSLSSKDLETLRDTHGAFAKQGLDLRFELHQKNGRHYPSLRELLEAKSEGGTGSFLGSADEFAFLRDMQEQHRIVPIVGDFAGDQALAKIAEELERRKLTVSVFYTSNVEQYLMEPETWKRWVRNIQALPSSDHSQFIRCYLDQGRHHPKQLKGHRTATVLQPFSRFKAEQSKHGYKSFWQLVTDG
ncbi:MAG: hypothetical protein H6718_04600 [Polyangiaceae bacterium]|nr:hypothetical protein [Myxococcales bacterium]MCB9584650.1 hypothetical protein [Polyangiaceae bacterium]MCB9609087.1 hypothetical protein [Polyangiaceae bacterium]